jgi:putative two-component system response regulator
MQMKAGRKLTILLVDDSTEILDALSAMLRPDYSVLAARTALAGIDLATQIPPPDLILLDVMMPDMDGRAALARLKDNPLTADIPVIFLTSLSDPASEEQGFATGASDYIAKPIQPNLLKARVRVHIEARQARHMLKAQNDQLRSNLVRFETDNDLTHIAAIRVLAHLAQTRDNATGRHCERVQDFVWLLAELLSDHERFKDTLTVEYIDLLVQSAPLHDIGKVGIPDRILLKPGPLDAEETAIMRTHAQLGWETIEKAEREIEHPVPFLSITKEIARSHHERWNGQGYPDGLAGDAIPVSARLVALADAFDALISHRPYKKPFSLDEARDLIAKERCVVFDPDVTDAFLGNFDQFVAIIHKYQKVDRGVGTTDGP